MDRYQAPQRRRLVGAAAETRTDGPAANTVGAYAMRNRATPRSRELVDAVLRLDTTTDPVLRKQLMDWIDELYQERQGGELVGLMAKCWLGEPFVDHRLDLTGHICEHFPADHEPPAPFGLARPLARSAAYAYIELYRDGAMVPVRHDGTQAV